MPEKELRHVLKQRTVWPPEKKRERISLPAAWPSFRYEYDSPVIWMPPSPSVWTLDFSFANRGAADQMFCILLTEFHFAPDQPTSSSGPDASLSGRIFLVNWTIEMLGSSDSSGWWARMFVTSRDVIPSLHVYADTPEPDTDPPYYPDFYFSPGDFAFFELTGGYVPPGFGASPETLTEN
jgi:hypothetical protein